MPVVTNFEQKVLQLIRQDKYSWFTVGVNLGGDPGPSGGSGVPPGGFTGQLIQSRVTYDTSETSSLDVPVSLSGASLLHNLNRIRYWLDEKNVKFSVEDEGVEIASGITVLNFEGAPVDVALASGYTDRVNITVSGLAYGSLKGNEIGWDNGGVAQDVWTTILSSGISVGLVNNVVFQNDGELKVNNAGVYSINYSITVNASIANKHVITAPEINGVEQTDGQTHQIVTAANGEFSMGGVGLLELSADDTVSIGVACDDASTPTITVNHIGITITQLR